MVDDDSTAGLAPTGDEPSRRRRRGGQAEDGAPERVAAEGRDVALRAVQIALIKEIDASISKLERARIGESTREHLEILRSLLKAQVTAYLEHFVARRATLFSHTSVMYAGEVGSPGVISTTFRGLLDGGTLTSGQGAKLAPVRGRPAHADHLRRPRDGQVDAAELALRAGPRRRALRRHRAWTRPAGAQGALVLRPPRRRRATPTSRRSSRKARRMVPGRLVVGEMHADEVREFFSFLAEDPRVGGMATLRAETVHRALDIIVAAFGGDTASARELVGARQARFRPHALRREGPAAPRGDLERRGVQRRRARCSTRSRPARRPRASWRAET